jgi:benzoyl-CoA reductase/2-hydroxyglutaryl-CoA dehydratase subunit BcrC/BadD/HgdB
MKKIGITTTIPAEVVFAAGCIPVDLNNVFISSPDAAQLGAEAEYEGYPRNACGWIKGIYSTVRRTGIDTIIAVVEGDCSQTQAMVETLKMQGVEIIPFSFPYGRDRDLLRLQIGKLIERLGTNWEDSIAWKRRLDAIRRKIWQLDEATWREGTISSFENHYYQVSCSDFNGDPDAFEAEVDSVLARSALKQPSTHKPKLRLGYIGVPPIFTDFYDYIENLGAKIVWNEVQRQFTMPFETQDLVEQYTLYTYPYDVFGRIEDIKREIERRNIAGLIHYTQSFCFRQIQDLIIRKHVNIPILTIEGDAPAKLDARSKIRIESFVEMLT